MPNSSGQEVVATAPVPKMNFELLKLYIKIIPIRIVMIQ